MKTQNRTSIFRRLYGKSLQELSTELKFSVAHIYRLHKSNKLEKYRQSSNEIGWLDKRMMKIWHNVNGRCTNPITHKYEYYGGKGIKNLLTIEDMVYLWKRDNAANLQKPSIDRLDSNGNYTIENCKFIEYLDNIKNRVYVKKNIYKPTDKMKKIFSFINQVQMCRLCNFPEGTFQNFLCSKSHATSEKKATKVVEAINELKKLLENCSIDTLFTLTDYTKQRNK